jgi:succinate-semialdehyde dehydrogenase/glutarate-semialdehyde dehydrogenase
MPSVTGFHFHPQFFINGQWVDAAGDPSSEVLNPATGDVLCTVRAPSAPQIDQAVIAASAAFNHWRSLPAATRSDKLRRTAALLRERLPRITEILTIEEGKPLAEARAEWQVTIEMFEWFAEEGRRAYGRIVPPAAKNVRHHVMREPVGPVAALCAWNFPARNPGYKIAAALAAGCTVVVKPAEETPFSCLELVRALQDAGIPDGVVNVVYGNAPWLSEQLLAHREIRKVSFTGSTRVGKLLARRAADTVKKVTMELGGHAPVIVCEDADIDSAVAMLGAAKIRNAGQVCISPTRFFVHEAVREVFVTRMQAHFARQVLGDGREAKTTMGPLIHPRRIATVDSLVQDAVARGGSLVTGGAPRAGVGSFYPLTLIDRVPEDARIMTEEPFGPVVPITSFTTLDDAIARANAVPYGLAAYAFTQSLKHATVLSERLETGMVGINTARVSYSETPFGGVKESGYGSEGGMEGLDAYLVTKAVTIAV